MYYLNFVTCKYETIETYTGAFFMIIIFSIGSVWHFTDYQPFYTIKFTVK
jgi:hypothetical protein